MAILSQMSKGCGFVQLRSLLANASGVLTAQALSTIFRITKHIMKAVKPIPIVKVNMASSR